MTDWKREYVDLVKELWRGYTTYVSAGATNGAFERHIWPVIKEAKKRIRQPQPTDDFKLRLAKVLCSQYDDDFGKREWDDLPDGCAELWLDDAQTLIDELAIPVVGC